ncbi:MAG: methionine--tRNA ligase [Candidatus Bathyarchaeia archaeon]
MLELVRKTIVTAALPYANYNLHLGHLRSTYLPADIYVRYLRLKGERVIYICATDEHGTPITIMAEREGKTPKEIVDKYHMSDLEDLSSMGCSFDFFGRTTFPVHYELTQEFFLKLKDKGYIYEGQIEQLYCSKEGRFLPDRFVEGLCPYCNGAARGDLCESCGRYLKPTELKEPRCAICGQTPELRETKHWFFRLSAFSDFLKGWIENNEGLSANVKNYALNWIRDGLSDWCITRDMDWGVPVPLDGVKNKVIYVWFDAPIGYVSNTIEWARNSGEPEEWRDFWQSGSGKIVHFIGKDIIYHHTLFWPAMLYGRGDFSLPSCIIGGEYLTLEGKKMSKSRNWMIEIADYTKKYEPDPLRFYLTIVSPLNKDADFSWEEFVRKNNDELADILGNFIHRSLMFTYKFYNHRIPKPSANPPIVLLEKRNVTVERVDDFLQRFEFQRALREIIELASQGNKFLNESEPWKKHKTSPDEAAGTLYICDQVVKSLAILISPFMPFSAEKLWRILNLPHSVHNQTWQSITDELPSGHIINKPTPLFRKIELKETANKKRDEA